MRAAPAPARSTGVAAARDGEEVARTTVVLDTSVLVSDPEALCAFAGCDVVVPLTVIEELDRHKTRADEVGWAARRAVRALESLRASAPGADLRSPVPAGDGATVRVELNGLHLDAVVAHGLDPAVADNRILAAALGLARRGGPVRLVSGDAALRLKAAQFGLDAADYQRHQPVEGHGLGWRVFDVAGEVVDAFYAPRDPAAADSRPGTLGVAAAGVELVPNECAVLRGPARQSVLVRRRGDDLVRLPAHQEVWGLRPRSKEQRFALDLLVDPDVAVVCLAGAAGTGKTLLALAAGLQQVVEDGRYDQLGVYRAPVPVGRADLGFLPGGLDDKLDPWMAAIEDNLAVLASDGRRESARRVRDELVARHQLVYGSLAHIRGRSIARTMILVDEVQNLEPSVLRVLLSRVGEGTKVVLTGDPSQIDSPYLSRSNNALSAVIDAFRGQDCFGYVVLTQGERSRVADLAATLL